MAHDHVQMAWAIAEGKQADVIVLGVHVTITDGEDVQYSLRYESLQRAKDRHRKPWVVFYLVVPSSNRNDFPVYVLGPVRDFHPAPKTGNVYRLKVPQKIEIPPKIPHELLRDPTLTALFENIKDSHVDEITVKTQLSQPDSTGNGDTGSSNTPSWYKWVSG